MVVSEMSSSPIGRGSIKVNSLRVGICLRRMVPVESASGDWDLLLAVFDRTDRLRCLRRRKIPLEVAPSSSDELEDDDESESLVDEVVVEDLVVMVVKVSVFVLVVEADPRRRCRASPTLSIA